MVLAVRDFRAMATTCRVAVDGTDGLAEAAEALVHRCEARWTRFDPASELSALNRSGGLPVVVSPDTASLVALAVEAWHVTGGRFDPTVLTALERAGYDRSIEHVVGRDLPGPPAAAPAPGCDGVLVDPATGLVVLPPGVGLDLGGIGKGFTADLVLAWLLDHGAAGALVDLGGDIAAGGRAPLAGGWVVGVADRPPVALDEGGVATSTVAERAWTIGGRPAHHVIDPVTGAPAATDLRSVTVLAGSATWAEVLAKAALVAGREDGAALLGSAGVTGAFVRDDGAWEPLAGFADYEVAA